MLIRYDIVDNKINENQDNGNILLFCSIDDEDKKLLIEKYNIDIHSITSSIDPDEVPRLESDDKNIDLIWKIPSTFKLGDISTFNVLSVGFFVRNNNLIIISSDFFSYLNEKPITPIKTIFDVLFFLLNSTIKHYIEHLKAIKLISREIQKKINDAMENKFLLMMFDLTEILIYYLDSINGNKIILNKLRLFLKSAKLTFNKNFFQDIINEAEQAGKQAEIYSQIFAGLMDARGTIVNNNMNVLIKNLTIINIIFLPLNLIAGIGGMSEFSTITKNIPWGISYGLLTIAMFIIGWVTLLFINKSNIKRKKIKKPRN